MEDGVAIFPGRNNHHTMTKMVLASILLAPIAFELGQSSVSRNLDWPDYASAILILSVGFWVIMSHK